ncbi:hypothetical protein LLY41_11905 [Cytobacillus firmus]|uniref:hypothetical protein n=1 Tax=Cytobacillus firmus TaxID=1399 RepID=UPI00218A578C|nr:hypothetical protein [Cytobacillus firmus]URM31143.1 hypothetical protein LLY41_11905 [Cytobacillus firmus]
MNPKELRKYWREKLEVPPGLSELDIINFWKNEDKPYSKRVEAVKEYGRIFNKNILVETGTFHGDMIVAVENCFDKIISIELDLKLYEEAKQKFFHEPNVEILHGDSGKILTDVLNDIHEPCLFWLDGHYIPNTNYTARGELDTPIMQELEQIFNHYCKEHVILIDDARCFIGPNPVLNGYPTIKELKEFVYKKNPELTFEVLDDIIRIFKKKVSKNDI